jgi:hypothetical protein
MYRLVNEELVQPSEWDKGLVEVDAFGMAAFAVKRKVFAQLEEHGISFPYFRFWYPHVSMMQQTFPSEDIYFCMALKAAGVPMYVDTAVVCPHLTWAVVDDGTWADYLRDHPDLRDGSLARPVPDGLADKLGLEAEA